MEIYVDDCRQVMALRNMLRQITPVILTYNEAPNIRRTLERLIWARDIVVVDSFSDDETLDIVSRFPQARIFQRHFDSHANQWNYALVETSIASDWVLALDADYILTPDLIKEIEAIKPDGSTNGYSATFVYCVHGRHLRGSAYPPVKVLFRHRCARYQQDGHTQRVSVEGEIGTLRSPILHDDRKPFSHWLHSQDKYVRLDAKKLIESDRNDLSRIDRIRKLRIIAPFAMFFYCLFVKRAILDGWAGLYYAFQRMLSEMLLSLYLIEHDFTGRECEPGKERNMASDKKPNSFSASRGK